MNELKDHIDIGKGKKELSGDRITVGVATCGISAGALPVLEKLKAAGLDMLVDPVGCSGMCYNEPIVTVTRNHLPSIYRNVTLDKVDSLISSIKSNIPYNDLFVAHELSQIDYYKKQQRFVMENCGQINPLSVEQYAASGGFSGLMEAMHLEPGQVVDVITESKLRGRGGAGFSTGVKWGFVSKKSGKKYLVCNADEGDPGAFMNRIMIESDPFKVLEGMMIAAYAIGADEAFVYMRLERPLSIKMLSQAASILESRGLLGKNILGREGFNLSIRIKKGAGAFVCGEETALMSSIMGMRGYPRPRPPFPAERGLWGKPTIINNVDTLANVASIMKIGLPKYTAVGTEKTKGTKTICLTGNIKRPGVVEVPFGIKLSEIVYDIGGGTPDGSNLKAVQTGGPAGGSIPAGMMNLALDYETLTGAGSIMGSGGFVVLSDKDCMVDVARYFMSFTQQESCGKCTPCREGTMRLLEILERITEGSGKKEDLELASKLAGFIRDSSLCGLGQNAPNPVLSTLRHFMDEYLQHVEEKTCKAGVCKAMTVYGISDKCVGCGNCARVCPAAAITGKLKERFAIDQKKCIKCGECFRNCAFKAITRNGSKD